MGRGIDRLVVLQSELQAQHYLAIREDADVVLPIGPQAMYQADRHGWRTCGLSDLWTAEQYEAEGRASQQRVDALIEALNHYSRQRNPSLGLELGHYYAFQLWIIIRQLRHNAFIVRGIARNLSPARVLCYTKANPRPFMELRPDPDALLGDALKGSRLFADGCREIIEVAERTRPQTLRERALSCLPESLRTRFRRWRDRRDLRNGNSPTRHLLVIGAGGDWLKLGRQVPFNEVFRLHPQPNLKTSGDRQATQELLALLERSIHEDDAAPYDLSTVAASMQSDLDLFAMCAEATKIDMRRYDAVVTAVLSFPRDNFFAHMAALADLPLIVWQHGEKGQSGSDPTDLYTELYYATDYFAYAPVVVEQYQPWLGKYRLESVVPIGSIEKRVEWQEGNVILYATGKWFKSTLPIDPDRRLLDAHMTILPFLDGQAGGFVTVLKANNTPGLNEIPYRFKNVKVEFERSFTDLLKQAKLVILDTPATTLVEACSTKVPIFVLGGRTSYTNDFLSAIKRRVVWSDTPEELVDRLADFLGNGSYQADCEDGTFIERYGARATPSAVAELARAHVINSIERHRGRLSMS